MSETKSAQDWQKDWQALQQQYWSAWQDASRGMPGQPDGSTPWHEGIEQWSQMVGGSGKQSEATDRVLGSAKAYVAMMQSMLASASGKQLDGQAIQTWIEAMRNGFNLPGLDASVQNNPLASLLGGITGPGAQGFDQLSAAFAPMLEQARAENLSWLRMPTFGYSREQDEHKQQAMLAFAEYQRALGQYNALILKSSQMSFGILESKLAERAEPGRQIESMRALYDLWVDAAEEAYAQVASSEEFRKAYGELVNAQMHVRASVQRQVEHVSSDLGMPTRTELNSVHRRLHDLRGKSADAKVSVGVDANELRQLREDVAALKAALSDAGSAATAKSAASSRKSKRPAPSKTSTTDLQLPKAAGFKDAISSMRNQISDKTNGKAQTAKRTSPKKLNPAKKTGKAQSKRGGKR